MNNNIILYGFYSEGNFGDDAMGRLFYQHLVSLGRSPIIISRDTSIFADYQVSRRSTPMEAPPNCLVVFGGGGLFTDTGMVRSLFHSSTRACNADLRQLLLYLRRNKSSACMIPISVGGDGSAIRGVRSSLLAFISHGGTVRLKGDLDQLGGQVKKIVSFPDILWSASQHFHVPVKNSTAHLATAKPIVGLNLKRKHINKLFLDKIRQLSGLVDFRWIVSHKDVMAHSYEYLDDEFPAIRYQGSVSDFLHELAGCRAVISSKLHVGLSAMSCGSVFYSHRGPQKAKSALMEAGLRDHITLNDEDFFMKIQEIVKEDSFISIHDRAMTTTRRLAVESFGHLSSLENSLLSAMATR